MTTSHMIGIVDRFALSLMHGMVCLGLPLVAADSARPLDDRPCTLPNARFGPSLPSRERSRAAAAASDQERLDARLGARFGFELPESDSGRLPRRALDSRGGRNDRHRGRPAPEFQTRVAGAATSMSTSLTSQGPGWALRLRRCCLQRISILAARSLSSADYAGFSKPSSPGIRSTRTMWDDFA